MIVFILMKILNNKLDKETEQIMFYIIGVLTGIQEVVEGHKICAEQDNCNSGDPSNKGQYDLAEA